MVHYWYAIHHTEEVGVAVSIELVSLIAAIGNRKSVRRYQDTALGEGIREELLAPHSLRKLNRVPCRVEYVEGDKPLDDIFTGIIGSYGKIGGARALLCLIVPTLDLEIGKMEAGYLGQQYVLRATALGLGSCWVGGTFNYKKLMSHLSIGPAEAVSAVIALGWPAERQDAVSKVLHTLVRRKGLSEIASPSLLAGPLWLKEALLAVRLAPSAINLQPWYFAGSTTKVELRSSRNGAFTPMDIGIAMLHFELAALAQGCSGQWHFEKKGQFFAVEQ